MGAPIDMTGQKFGRLTVLSLSPVPALDGAQPVRQWLCRCDCGTEIHVRGYALRKGETSSCGCAKSEATAAFNVATKTKHGRSSSSGRGQRKPERLYRTWFSMVNRCYCPTASNFRHYGAKGVTVCDRWRESFDAFREDVGEHPGGRMSIDRIDPFGNYEPGNVRWATPSEQARNQRRHHRKEAA